MVDMKLLSLKCSLLARLAHCPFSEIIAGPGRLKVHAVQSTYVTLPALPLAQFVYVLCTVANDAFCAWSVTRPEHLLPNICVSACGKAEAA